jgi:lysophospholipase L1-like esterase
MRLSRVLLLVVAIAPLVVAAAPVQADPLPPSYVALGDSYASGPLIPGYEPVYGCLRSTNNYAHLLAPKLGLPLRDATCAGAESEDMAQAQGVTPGPNPPQYDRLDAGTQVVTFQIGGNDIGFSGVAQDCFAPTHQGTPCQDAHVHGTQDDLTDNIAAALPNVTAAIAGIKTRAPSARIFAIGYPAIVPDSDAVLQTATCWPQLPVAKGDIPWIRAKTKELNAMVASAAAANGVNYVDIYGPSVGHDSCKLPGIRWVEPLVPVGPAAPIHPNLVGMLNIAKILKAYIQSH